MMYYVRNAGQAIVSWAADKYLMLPKLKHQSERSMNARADECRIQHNSAAVFRIIDMQALKIDQLEQEQREYQKHRKAVEWAKMELHSATSANARWKELCDQLQEQIAKAATTHVAAERQLHHTVAKRNQKIVSLRVAQEELKEELLDAQECVARLSSKCEGLQAQAENAERMNTRGTPIGIDMGCVECDRMQRHMNNSRQQLADARESMLKAQQESEEAKIMLKRANMELEQAAATARTQELRQKHTASLQEELSQARNQLQELLQDNKSDDITLIQQELSSIRLQCTRETARADAAEAEIQQLLEIVPERDALKDLVATLQHALNDMQTTTGAADVREVLQRYQARERTSEQLQEQLRTRIEQLETQEGVLQERVGTLKGKNKELQVRLSSSDSHVERLQGLQRTSAGEISFLRARLDFHLTAMDTVAKRDAAKLSQDAHGAAESSGVPDSDMIVAMHDAHAVNTVPRISESPVPVPSSAETATLQTYLDDTRKQVEHLESSKKEADKQLAAAEAARIASEMRVKQEQKVVEQLKLALELQRLTHTEATSIHASTDQQKPAQSADTGPEQAVRRELCEHQLMIIQRENERLRGQLLHLAKKQAENKGNLGKGSSGSSSSTGAPSTTAQSQAVLAAQLAIAQQQAADYQARIEKLSGFFTHSMQDLRAVTQDILGWKLTPHRAVGEHEASYTFSHESGGVEDVYTLTAARNNQGELVLSATEGWTSINQAVLLLANFQEGAVGAPVLCAQLVVASAIQQEENTATQCLDVPDVPDAIDEACMDEMDAQGDKGHMQHDIIE